MNWRQIKWLRFEKNEPYCLFYKNKLVDQEFSQISLKKKGNAKPVLSPPKSYYGVLPVAEEKKKDLIEMLPYISPVYKDFYLNLTTLSKNKKCLPRYNW